MGPSAPAAHGPEGARMTDALVERETEAVDQRIARVLRQARLTAYALDDPNEARAILDVAHSFADELASANPEFDRMRFIEDVTEDPSATEDPPATADPS